MPPYVQGDIFGNVCYAKSVTFPEPTDIFLAIISLAIVVVAIIAGWVGVLLIRTLKNVLYISRTARKESDKIIGEMDSILHFLRSLGMLFRSTKKKKK